MINTEKYDVWLKTNVHFHKFMLDVSTTEEKEPVKYPRPRANTYPLHDLLRMANVNVKEVEKTGAIMMVNAIFDCNLDSHVCQTKVESGLIDSHTGYNYVQNYFYYDGDVRKRDTYRLFGVRLVVFATGRGSKTSFAMVVLQVS